MWVSSWRFSGFGFRWAWELNRLWSYLSNLGVDNVFGYWYIDGFDCEQFRIYRVFEDRSEWVSVLIVESIEESLIIWQSVAIIWFLCSITIAVCYFYVLSPIICLVSPTNHSLSLINHPLCFVSILFILIISLFKFMILIVFLLTISVLFIPNPTFPYFIILSIIHRFYWYP